MEPAARIELAFPDYETGIMPLYYTGEKLEPRVGIKPTTSALQVRDSIKLSYRGKKWSA